MYDRRHLAPLRPRRTSRVGGRGRRDSGAGRELLRDPLLWAFMGANALSMIGYSLWTNWTTLYLVETHGLTLVERIRMPANNLSLVFRR